MAVSNNLRAAYGSALVALGKKFQDIVTLEADLGKSTQSVMFQAEFPERHFEMGIAEQNMASTAAGLALAGKMPFMAYLRRLRFRSGLRPAPQLDLRSGPERPDLRLQFRIIRLQRRENASIHRRHESDEGATQHDRGMSRGFHRSPKNDGLSSGLERPGLHSDKP